MKVVILCGGIGARLKEETEFRPKPLVKVGEMPVLWHVMKIYSHFGFKDFILCLGYKGEMIKEYFLNFEAMTNDFTLNLRKKPRIKLYDKSPLEDWKITFVDTGQTAQTGARIMKIKKYIGTNKDFLLTYGDGVSNVDIKQLVAYHRKMNKTVTVTGVHSTSVFGLIEPKNGLVKTFREKPKLQDIISGGFFVCNSSVFQYLSDNDACVFEDKPLRTLAKNNDLALYQHGGFWYAMDTQKHVNHLNELWESGNPPWKIW